MRRRILLSILCCSFVLAGCERTELYGDLNQNGANEILVLLMKNGIEAELARTTRQNETYYGVTVDPDDLDAARALLQENNLPSAKQPGLADIFKEPGFIPTPQEQKARFLLALKGEVINALEQIPDVVEADIILNIPSPEEFGADDSKKKPSASVVIKVRPTNQVLETLTEAKVQRFVANAIEKLDPRDVSVILAYTGSPPGGVMPGDSLILSNASGGGEQVGGAAGTGSVITVAGLAVSPESATRLKVYLGLFLVLLAILSLGLVIMVIQASKMREKGAKAQNMALPSGEEDDFPQLGSGN